MKRRSKSNLGSTPKRSKIDTINSTRSVQHSKNVEDVKVEGHDLNFNQVELHETTNGEGSSVKNMSLAEEFAMEESKVVKKTPFKRKISHMSPQKVLQKCNLLIMDMIEDNFQLSDSEEKIKEFICYMKILYNQECHKLNLNNLQKLMEKCSETLMDYETVDEDIALLLVRSCLLTLASPNMPLTVYSEDTINQVLNYLKTYLKHFYNKVQTKAKLNKSEESILKDLEIWLKDSLILLHNFFTIKTLKYQVIDEIVNTCFDAIFIAQTSLFCIPCVDILVFVFKKYETSRLQLLSLLSQNIANISEKYKVVTTIQIGDVKVTVFTYLIMRLIQCLPLIVKCNPDDKNSIMNSCNHLKDSFELLMKVGGHLIAMLIKICASSVKGHKQIRLFVSAVVSDLLQVANNSDWPVARFLLQLIQKLLALVILEQKDVAWKAFAVNILRDIATTFYKDEKTLPLCLKDLVMDFKKDMEDMNDNEVVEKLIIMNLKLNKNLTEDPRGLYQVLWYDNHKENGLLLKKGLLLEGLRPGRLKLTRQQASAAVSYISTHRHNYTNFSTFVNYILQACLDQSKVVKLACAHALKSVVFLDPNLLSNPIVITTLEQILDIAPVNGRQAICRLIGEYLRNNIDKEDGCMQYLFKCLNDDSMLVKKTCIEEAKKLAKMHKKFTHKTKLCLKVLSLVQDPDTAVQSSVAEFAKVLWLESASNNLPTLLEMIETGPRNTTTWLHYVFEDTLKSKTASQPSTYLADAWYSLLAMLSNHMIANCANIPQLKILLVISKIAPKRLVSFIPVLTKLLISSKFSLDARCLAAEILCNLIPVWTFVQDVMSLQAKFSAMMMGDDSLGFDLRLTMLFLRVMLCFDNLAYDPDIMKKWFITCVKTLETEKNKENINTKYVYRALRTVVFLLNNFPEESKTLNVVDLLEHYLKQSTFFFVTAFSICYMGKECPLLDSTVLHECMLRLLNEQESPKVCTSVLSMLILALDSIHNKVFKGNLKQIDDNSSISNLVQLCLPGILKCAISIDTISRATASAIIKQIIIGGMVMEDKLIPYFMCMCMDNDQKIKNNGQVLVERLKLRSTWLLIKNFTRGLLLCHSIDLKLSNCTYARGYINIDGTDIARGSYLYSIVQEKIQERRQVINAIFKQLHPVATTNLSEKLYLIDHLVCFPYKYLDEVMYVVRSIHNVISVISIPDVVFKNDKDRINFISQFYGYYLFEKIEIHLKKCYNITDRKLISYVKNDSKEMAKKGNSTRYMIPEMYLPNFENCEIFAFNMLQYLKKLEEIASQSSQSSAGSEILKEKRKTPIKKKYVGSVKKTPDIDNDSPTSSKLLETKIQDERTPISKKNSKSPKNTERKTPKKDKMSRKTSTPKEVIKKTPKRSSTSKKLKMSVKKN